MLRPGTAYIAETYNSSACVGVPFTLQKGDHICIIGNTLGPWLGGLVIDLGWGYPAVAWTGAALAAAAGALRSRSSSRAVRLTIPNPPPSRSANAAIARAVHRAAEINR